MSDNHNQETGLAQVPSLPLGDYLFRVSAGAVVFSVVTAFAGPIAGAIAASLVSGGSGDGGAGGACA